jgi:hypothetical protein
MASDRQIAANRRNAQKSTGPRSPAAKTRASRNALRHGLTLDVAANAAYAKIIDALACKIAGQNSDEIVFGYAREVAIAECELARIRRTKVRLIERVLALGSVDPPPIFRSSREELRYVDAVLRGQSPPALPMRLDPSTTMPTDLAERVAEAIRRALPDLLKLERYQSRAIARRNRAIRQIMARRSNRSRNTRRDTIRNCIT